MTILNYHIALTNQEMVREASIDLSWILVAFDKYNQGWIMDASEGFWDRDFFVNGTGVEDSGIYVPKGTTTGIYEITNIKITGGGPDWQGEYWGPEISGTWKKLDLNSLRTMF